jgi:hypothetical protein
MGLTTYKYVVSNGTLTYIVGSIPSLLPSTIESKHEIPLY